jgi:hypothetical protein
MSARIEAGAEPGPEREARRAARQARRDAIEAREMAALDAQLAAAPADPAARVVGYQQAACGRLKFWAGWHLGNMAARDVAAVDDAAPDAEAAAWESALHGIGPLADALAAACGTGDREAIDAAADAIVRQIRACKAEAEGMFCRAEGGNGGDVTDAYCHCAELDEGPMLGNLRLVASMEEIKRRMQDGEIAPADAQLEACEVLAFGWTLGGLVGRPQA